MGGRAAPAHGCAPGRAPRAHACPHARWGPRRRATSAEGGPRRPGHNKAPAGGRGGRRGRGRREQHPTRATPPPVSPRPQTPRPAARSPAAAQRGWRSGRRERAALSGIWRGGGPGCERHKRGWGAAVPPAPTGAPGRLGPAQLRATARSHSASGPLATRRSAALPGRTLRTLRMNDDSAAHLEQARVAPASSGAGPLCALHAAICRCSWLWRILLGTLQQALGPTPIPAERTSSLRRGWCVPKDTAAR
ncbi:synapsin-1-like [Saccopteryx bilineata]|uniref:synapsin-1-like n=1 Tax=Saccopteryx bilineata TaxID=59482 RepID=UPI00338F4C66